MLRLWIKRIKGFKESYFGMDVEKNEIKFRYNEGNGKIWVEIEKKWIYMRMIDN